MGDSQHLVATATLDIGNDDAVSEGDLSRYISEAQNALGKSLILVSGSNPAITYDGVVSGDSTLLDNFEKLLEGIKDPHKVIQLGPITPEGGKYKARGYADGNCSFDTLSGAHVTVPASVAFDAGYLMECTEELGLGATPASVDGLLGRFHGLRGVEGRFHFEPTQGGRYLCHDDVPVLKVSYESGEPQVTLETNDQALAAVQKAFADVPATLSIGLNRNFGPITLVANYVASLDRDTTARTPLSMEVETSGHPLVLSIPQLGQVAANVQQYSGGSMQDRRASLLTTITTMGMYAQASNPEFWQDVVGASMPERLRQYQDTGFPWMQTAQDLGSIKNFGETLQMFQKYDANNRLEAMLR
ncbi:hypothetical protein COV20_00350 [Candidatus Woesearchaeota archaeon CG10_big_fil_rev_8_21_14_0_10_45_16]|nr:MAG: hypothetical protein COV20_00350 [Candidatus Woesearchaeota archaeon CG10_big_fil_rev_8_21_14_0_10_45_16]